MTGDSLLAGLPAARLRRLLLAWYDHHGRDLPWRRDPTLYGTWISEIMLQQTTVATVVPYWQRFLARFPDVASLAAAPLSEVLALWSGLGYYRRARHLHAAAVDLVRTRGGVLPDSLAGWSRLPGVGSYTAGAIASIGLGLPVPAVDANARRVFTRWLDPIDRVDQRLTARSLAGVAAGLVDRGRPGDFNQAVMELGATICRARAAACAQCPLASVCRGGRTAHPEAIGRAAARPPAVPAHTSMLILRAGGRVLVLPSAQATVARARGLGRPVRDDFTTLHQGLFGLPQTPWYRAADVDVAGRRLEAAWRRWLRDVAGVATAPMHLGQVAHAITRYRLRVDVFEAASSVHDQALLTRALGGRWVWPTLRESSDSPTWVPVSRIASRCLGFHRKTGHSR